MQRSLFTPAMQRELARVEHGGALSRGRRKTERPVSTRRPMHVVLSSARARGAWDLRRHGRAVKTTLREAARRRGVRVYEFANVRTHIHLLVRARRREDFQAFLREFAGLVARRVTGARRGSPRGRFWNALAWSRIVTWGRGFVAVRHYVVRNEIEATEGRRIRLAMENGVSSAPRAPPPRAPSV